MHSLVVGSASESESNADKRNTYPKKVLPIGWPILLFVFHIDSDIELVQIVWPIGSSLSGPHLGEFPYLLLRPCAKNPNQQGACMKHTLFQ